METDWPGVEANLTTACYDTASFLNIKMAAAGEEASNSAADTIVTEYATYEDYLDSQITPTDLFYLEVRLLLEVGG